MNTKLSFFIILSLLMFYSFTQVQQVEITEDESLLETPIEGAKIPGLIDCVKYNMVVAFGNDCNISFKGTCNPNLCPFGTRTVEK